MSKVAAVRLAIIAGAILLLEALCRLNVISPLTLIPPSKMAVELARLLVSGTLNDAIARTLSTILFAFTASVTLGFASGLLIHALPRLRRAVEPLLAAYYGVPVFVFYPLLVALFGVSIVSLVIIGFAFALAAMMISTVSGLDRVPRVLLKLARVHRLSRLAEAFLIVLPAAAPYLFTGVKLALAYSFIGVLAGEFILSNGGLGYLISDAYDNFETPKMYALMLFVLILATALNMALHYWERRLLRRRVRQ